MCYNFEIWKEACFANIFNADKQFAGKKFQILEDRTIKMRRMAYLSNRMPD